MLGKKRNMLLSMIQSGEKGKTEFKSYRHLVPKWKYVKLIRNI